MRIVPHRSMMLDGHHVERGTPVDVSTSAGEIALRMGWASEIKVLTVKRRAPDAAAQPQPVDQ